jgi:hypothetical protein
MTNGQLEDAINIALLRRGLSDTDEDATLANTTLTARLVAIARDYAADAIRDAQP